MFFLFSAFSKAVDTVYFSQVIISYGFPELYFIAPLIIIFEAFLGVSLFVRYRVRIMCLISVCFVIALTMTYIYALIVNDISDCGCFGHLTILNRSPIAAIGKNLILIILLLIIQKNVGSFSNGMATSRIIMVSIIAVVSFLTGITFKGAEIPKLSKSTDGISEEMLQPYISTTPDSTYLVFLFSYNCSHCLNSIANLKEYKRLNKVDKIIAITVGNKDKQQWFNETFNPDFEIKNVGKELFELTNKFPVALFIKNDSIQIEMSGILPHPAVLDKALSK